MGSFLLSKGDRMAQKLKKNNKIERKRIFIGIIFFIAVYLLINFISTLKGVSKNTVLPEDYVLYDRLPSKGIVIKKEIVYRSENSGQLNKLINEGDRVPVGVEVANISFLNDNSQHKQELLEINQRIEVLAKTGTNSIDGDKNPEKLDSNNDAIIEEIQESVNNDNFLKVHYNKEEIKAYEKYIVSDNNLLDQSLEALKERRDALSKQINSNNKRYYSNESGIVSYDLDGYEEILLPKDFENYIYDELVFDEKVEPSNDGIIPGKPMFKIINNYEWYMAIKIDDKEDVSEYEVGQTMLLELENDIEINGKIINKNITNNNAVLILKMTTYLHNDYNMRFNNVDIVKSKSQGFKIPTSTIFDNAGIKGVYIKEINGIVKFRPVLILGEVGEYTIIDKGNNNGYIELTNQENPVRTVTLYDEIFLNPNSVIEGEILK